MTNDKLQQFGAAKKNQQMQSSGVCITLTPTRCVKKPDTFKATTTFDHILEKDLLKQRSKVYCRGCADVPCL